MYTKTTHLTGPRLTGTPFPVNGDVVAVKTVDSVAQGFEDAESNGDVVTVEE